MIRLSTALGISGFSELQEILQSWAKARLAPPEKLRSAQIKRRTDLYETIFENSIRIIAKAREEIQVSKREEVVSALNKAKRVFVVGIRRSHSIAIHLYYNLSRILNSTSLIDPAYGLIHDQVVDIGKRDVLIAISFSRYARVTLEGTRFAKALKAFVIGVTDNPLHPVGQLTGISLCVDYRIPFFFGSHAGTLVIADCIVGGLSLKHKRRYVSALTKLEDTLRQWVWIE